MEKRITIESEITAHGKKISYDIIEKERRNIRFPQLHTHSYYELLMVTKGEQIYQVELSSHIKLYEGDILFVPSFIPHDTYRTSCNTMRCIVVKFSPTYIYPSEIEQADIDCILIPPKFEKKYYVFRNGEAKTEELAELLKKIHLEYTESNLGYEITLRGFFNILYIWLLRNCINGKSNIQYKKKYSEPYIKDFHIILQFLNDNYQTNISMQEIAKMCYMDYSQFSKLFKKIMGKNFSEYLFELRINYAKKMLLQDKNSISAIATSCGFEYLSYFTRKFKQATGYTPKEYRHLYKNVQIPDTFENESHYPSRF